MDVTPRSEGASSALTSAYPAPEARKIYKKEDVLNDAMRQLEGLLFSIFPNGFADPQGKNFFIGGLDGRPGQSMSVQLKGEKAGLWYDFATGEGGDLLRLWKQAHNLDGFPEVLQHLAGATGTHAEVIRRTPAKKQAPRRTINEGKLVASYVYRDAVGQPIVTIDRFEHDKDGKKVKTFRPSLHGSGGHKFPEPRPLYNLPGILHAEEVVIAEGEKSADALCKAGIPATSAMGGAKAPFDKTDWSPLSGKTVYVWPDHDEAGESYAEMLVKNLATEGAKSVRILPIDPNRPEKWDAADAARDGENVASLYAEMKARAVIEPRKDASISIAADATAAIVARFPDAVGAADVDADIIREMIEGSFWSGAKGRLFVLTEEGQLNQFPAQEGWRFLCRRFGNPVEMDEILRHIGAGSKKTLEEAEKEAIQKAVALIVSRHVLDHIKDKNQREKVDWRVDMFASKSCIKITDRRACAMLAHKPFKVDGEPCAEIVADYKQHFPELDSVVEFLVASRFALDRKKSYLWLLAASNWGKGFFMGVLQSHEIVVEMSVKEIEAVFEGKAVGKSPEDFTRAMVLAVDEFKTVKAELKQLQSTISLAPKYQLSSEVEIFTKLFMSAENVTSLVGEHGVEDQFTNRMSVLMGQDAITARPLYCADASKYFRSICQYVGARLNLLIEEYRALGRAGAEARADRFLSGFIANHGLGIHYGKLSDSYHEIANEFMHWVRLQPNFFLIDGTREYVHHIGKALDNFLEANYPHSEVATLKKRRSEITAAMAVCGSSAPRPHRVNGILRRVVRIL